MVKAVMVIIRFILALLLFVNSAYAVPIGGRSTTQVLDISKEASGNYRGVRSTDDEAIRILAVNSAYANRRDAQSKRIADTQSMAKGQIVLYRAIYADGASQDVVVVNPLSGIAVKFHSEQIILPFLNSQGSARMVTLPLRLIDAHVVEETGYWKDWSISVCEGAGCTKYGSTWISIGYTFVAYNPNVHLSPGFPSYLDYSNPLSAWEGQASSLGGAAMEEFYRIMQRIVDRDTIQVYAQ